jgi:hypothetical protein
MFEPSTKLLLSLESIYEMIIEGPREVTGRGGGVNGSRIKFFHKNRPMSQVQTPKPKPCKKVMNTPTNSIEMIPSKFERNGKIMGLIGH